MTCPHFRFQGGQVTRAHFRSSGCHVNPPRWASDSSLPHTCPPRPMQADPIRVIKPRAKMAPTGIQDSTTRATSSSEDSREQPNFRFGGTHVICPHFRFGDSHVTHPSILVRRDSCDPPPLLVPRVSGDPDTIPVHRVSRGPSPNSGSAEVT